MTQTSTVQEYQYSLPPRDRVSDDQLRAQMYGHFKTALRKAGVTVNRMEVIHYDPEMTDWEAIERSTRNVLAVAQVVHNAGHRGQVRIEI